MAEDWGAVQAEIAEAIGDVGHIATLIRPGGRDPASPEVDPVFLPDQRIPIRLMGDTISLGLISNTYGPNTTIHATDRREMMAFDGTTPTPDDRVQIGDTTYSVIRAEPYAPGGEPLYFDLILRA